MKIPDVNPEFEALLDHLKHSYQWDLTGYKRSTLLRRFHHRMQTLNIDTYANYLQYLKHHSNEYLALLDDVLINVTTFFRDREAWSYLETEIIPQIIASKQPDETIRVWSAGCATGQEIYSLLILLAEALGLESCVKRVQCYATDADAVALEQARQGIFSELEISSVPLDLRQKYFEPSNQGYVFDRNLRSTIVFGQHDLSKDTPMLRIDLLMCRNVLIYFNVEAQAAILTRLHFGLKKSGFLFLGKAEKVIDRRSIFTPVHGRHRVYAKGLNLELQDHLSVSPSFHQKQAIDASIQHSHFWQTAFETNPSAQLAVGFDGYLMAANDQANRLFGLTPEDWKHPFKNLLPGRLLDSNTTLQLTLPCHHPIVIKDLEWNTAQDSRYFDVAIAPVLNVRKHLIGNTLTFLEQTDRKQLAGQLEKAQIELEKLSATLQVKQTELDSAYQEIQILNQQTHHQY